MTVKRKNVSTKRFYEGALSEAERSDLPAALEMEGVDEEIAMLRLRLRTVLEANPGDLQLMSRGIDLLAKVLAARFRLSKDDTGQVTEAIASLREQLAAQTWRSGDD